MTDDRQGSPKDAGTPKPTLKRGLLDEYLQSRPAIAIPEARDYFAATEAALKQKSFDDILRMHGPRDELNLEIVTLRNKISEATSELQSEKKKGADHTKTIRDLEKLVHELRVKEDLGFLLTRVNASAQQKLIGDEAFRETFAEDIECQAFVMSVDIRRSTELMLKARSPSMFAEFISALTKKLYSCVVENNGVFDKFTGDGVLAFFPEGFSGQDFGYSVVKAADECHREFEAIYRASRSSFTSVLKAIGLGIGIDYGTVRLLRVAEGLTVVGVPVVYACRLSGSEPGQTLLNQPAFEAISNRFGKHLVIEETSLNIKHEGEVCAYSVKLGHTKPEIKPPSWLSSACD